MDAEHLGRFMSHVQMDGDHWIWTGQFNSQNSPVPVFLERAPLPQRWTKRSARLAIYEHAKGPARRARVTCDRPKCVNPDHLVSGDPRSPEKAAQCRAYYRRYVMHGRIRRDDAKVRKHIHWLVDEHDQSFVSLAKRSGLSHDFFKAHYRHDGTRTVTEEQEARVLALRPESAATPHQGRRLDAWPTARRLQALWADGFPTVWIAREIGHESSAGNLQDMIAGRQPHVMPATKQTISDLYDKLEGVTPEEMLIPPRDISKAKTYALKKGCAPRHCWDEDTIDDPEAIPEWTGLCGTSQGYDVHRREGHVFYQKRAAKGCGYQQFFACAPCRKAAHEANVGRLKAKENACT